MTISTKGRYALKIPLIRQCREAIEDDYDINGIEYHHSRISHCELRELAYGNHLTFLSHW